MTHRTELRELAISDTGFVFDPRTGSTFTVNGTGLLVLQGLREGQAVEAIVERLAGRFGRPRAELSRDVGEFIRLLEQHALVAAS